MRKIQSLALGVIMATGVLVVSCDGGSSTNVALKTNTDTLSYAYGVELADKGLTQYLSQLGVVQDTAEVRMSYNYKIEAEADATKKADLQKEMTTKLDSISKANVKNLKDFIAGVKESIKADESKAAYMRGVEIGTQLKQMSDNFGKQVLGAESKEKINQEALLAGLFSVLNKEKSLVENASELVEAKMRATQEVEMKKQYGANIEAGNKFLAENKAKDGVVTLPDGLQYKIIKAGNGPKPTAESKVKVHYHGTLIDGTVFDSSVDRKEPAVFGVNQVIKGWTEALQLMPVGSKWIIYVPADLAYGAGGQGAIQPFSTLIFEVELISIEG